MDKKYNYSYDGDHYYYFITEHGHTMFPEDVIKKLNDAEIIREKHAYAVACQRAMQNLSNCRYGMVTLGCAKIHNWSCPNCKDWQPRKAII